LDLETVLSQGAGRASARSDGDDVIRQTRDGTAIGADEVRMWITGAVQLARGRFESPHVVTQIRAAQ
jgi:hypothetical protein